MTKLVRSRWLDTGQVLFLRVYGPQMLCVFMDPRCSGPFGPSEHAHWPRISLRRVITYMQRLLKNLMTALDAPICQMPLVVRRPYLSDAPICQVPLFVICPYLSDAPICQVCKVHVYMCQNINICYMYLPEVGREMSTH